MRPSIIYAYFLYVFKQIDFAQIWTYLVDINERAKDRLQVIISQMQKAESVIEKMKEDNQWEWIQRMSSIHNRTEEIVLDELIYR